MVPEAVRTGRRKGARTGVVLMLVIIGMGCMEEH